MLSASAITDITARGLAAIGHGYERWPDGTFYWRGERPSPVWHAHGVLVVRPKELHSGRLIRLVVAKQRWRLKGTNTTCHSRPPDDLGRRYTAVVILAALYCWLASGAGVHVHERIPAGLDAIDPRTLQRWLTAALPHGLRLQQAVRLVILDRGSSPERLFPSGLAPPRGGRPRWRAPDMVDRLLRGLSMALGAAVGIEMSAAAVLAEAHRRSTHEPFLIG